MDAARLVAEGERVMRGTPRPDQVIAEAWQAYELAEALWRLLGHTPDVPVTGAGPPRAARLTRARDPAGTLGALRHLLGDIGVALVDATCSAEDASGYWLCIEALDVVDEAKDLVEKLARELARGEREEGGDPGVD